MKIRIMVDFIYKGDIVKDFEKFARANNVSVEEVVRQGMQNLFDDCYMCADGESYEITAKMLED